MQNEATAGAAGSKPHRRAPSQVLGEEQSTSEKDRIKKKQEKVAESGGGGGDRRFRFAGWGVRSLLSRCSW